MAQQSPQDNTPQEHVESVRRAVSAGYYRIGGDRIAESIIRKLAVRRTKVSALRGRVIAGTYEADADRVAEAIVRQLDERDVRDDEREMPGEPEPLALAPSRPTTEELARAQLNRYAIDLKHSFERELRRTKELEDASVAMVRTLAMVAERDDETGNHIQRVHDLGLLLAREVVPEDAEDPQLAYGLILHDIGKVAVPDAVLRKHGPLDDTELEMMQTHPGIGARILEPLPFLSRARELVLHHHERWDGSGYPDGLEGDEIPVWARLFAVVDALDAMAGGDHYEDVDLESAIDRIVAGSGTLFDPRCVAGLVALDRFAMRGALFPAAENRLRSLVA